jgi:predicted ATPase
MAFSLVQDRLYIKAQDSNLSLESQIPEVVYVPPVAGLDARDEFATPAKRRAMLGRGLAGSVLRNFLLELYLTSKVNRETIFGVGKKKRTKAELRALEEFNKTDPWERLNEMAREQFGLELSVEPFEPNFHSVIRVNVQPKRRENSTWVDAGVARDLMVEGSGAQQWLTVLTFALAPATSVLLLDEPDAHLYTNLKISLFESLESISASDKGPQILVATHAPEILKRAPLEKILTFGQEKPAFLKTDIQRVNLLTGLGDNFSPFIDMALQSRAMLIVEGDTDNDRLKKLAAIFGINMPKNLAVWTTPGSHSDRLKVYKVFAGAIDGLRAVSLRDRDNQPLNTVDELTMEEKGFNTGGWSGFKPLTWRRREFENYALVPEAITKIVDRQAVENWWRRQGWAWPHDPGIETHLTDADIKQELESLLSIQGKCTTDVFECLEMANVHRDILVVLKTIQNLGSQ